MSSKYKVHLSENTAYEVEVADDGTLRLNGRDIDLDAVKTGTDHWNVLYDHKSYNVRVLAFDKDRKRLTLSVDGEEFDLKINSRLDELLDKMGMSSESSAKMVDVRAPMPGLVLNILVSPGTEVHEGDPLIILEAMKMENIIKATGKGTVAKILVSNQDAVDKNQVLIEME